ncbi:MAG: hypothetical protein JJT76_02790 [Clostridiaceae bacterium]|nr:hypothetical protein [Clostridiaceae bacterium]
MKRKFKNERCDIMLFFEKIQEIGYDILGYIAPGLLLLIYLMPWLWVKINSFETFVSPGYILLNHDKFNNQFTSLMDYDYRVLHFVLIFLAMYLLGHMIRAIALLYIKLLKIKNILFFYKKRSKESKEKFRTLCERATRKTYEIFLAENFPSQGEEDNQKEELSFILSYARSLIRANQINTLVQKYIAKYNLYLSFSVVFLIISIDIILAFIITMFLDLSILKIITGLLAIILCLGFHFIFHYEFCRHKELADKEALFGLVHYFEAKGDSFKSFANDFAK